MPNLSLTCRLSRLLTTTAAAICLLPVAGAVADTLVYVKNGTVYVAQPDGAQARAITSGSNSWAWPSETDAGVIAVAGGLSRVNGTFNPSGSDEIYEFNQQGRLVAGPVATQGTYSTVNDPEYVSQFRVAPDNSAVAWTDLSAFASPFTSWRNPSGSGSFSTANDSYGAPLPYSTPQWWGSGHLLLTHDGATIGTQPEYTMYSLADGSNSGWAFDDAIGNASSYEVAVSRDGLKFAAMTDDGPDNNGTIQNIAITLETAAAPASGNVTDTHCTITLPAGQFATSHGSKEASMSFSSDGSTLAWGQDDGVYEANVSNPNDCAAITSSVHLVVPGGAMPFLGAAQLSAVQSRPAPNTKITAFALNRRARRATIRFSGSGTGRLHFQCRLDRGAWKLCRAPWTIRRLARGKHVIAVRAVTASGQVDRSPATKTFKVGG
jgi:hypothetical protein